LQFVNVDGSYAMYDANGDFIDPHALTGSSIYAKVTDTSPVGLITFMIGTTEYRLSSFHPTPLIGADLFSIITDGSTIEEW